MSFVKAIIGHSSNIKEHCHDLHKTNPLTLMCKLNKHDIKCISCSFLCYYNLGIIL